MTEPKREDWPMMVAFLAAHGISHWKLGQMLKPICQAHQVARWADVAMWENGTEPSHWIGEQIKAIYADVVERVSRETVCAP